MKNSDFHIGDELVTIVHLMCFTGPFRYLDLHGARQLVDKMERYQRSYGEPFVPCQLLMDHAKDPSKHFHK